MWSIIHGYPSGNIDLISVVVLLLSGIVFGVISLVHTLIRAVLTKNRRAWDSCLKGQLITFVAMIAVGLFAKNTDEAIIFMTFLGMITTVAAISSIVPLAVCLFRPSVQVYHVGSALVGLGDYVDASMFFTDVSWLVVALVLSRHVIWFFSFQVVKEKLGSKHHSRADLVAEEKGMKSVGQV